MRMEARHPHVLWMGLTLIFVIALSAPGPVWAAVQCDDSLGEQCCMDDRDPFNGLNCTANDLTFVLVGLGIQDDGCVNPSDTFDIWMRAVLENTTSQTRYDVGLWIATDGDPNGDGALTGECSREQLANPSGVLDSLSCTDLNLSCGYNPDAGGTLGDPSGPIYDADLDGCGDIFEGPMDCGRLDDFTDPTDGDDCTLMDGLEDETVMDFRSPAMGIACTDLDGSGFVDLAVCASYANNPDQIGASVGGSLECNTEDDLAPGTKAKCQCDPGFESNIPAPNLALSCSCSPNPVDPGGTTTCTVSYTNSLPNLVGSPCLTDPNKQGRFRCGTASFLRYRIDYDEAQGTVTGFTSTRGTIQDQDTNADTVNDTLLWTPANVAGSSGVISANETDTLSFTYEVDADTPDFTTIDMTATSFWSNAPSFTNEVQQTALSCSLEVTTTPVTVAAVQGRKDGPGAVLEWSTATETANLGFHAYEVTGGQLRRLNDELIPSRVGDTFEVQDYRFEAPRFRGRTFALEDVATDGATRLHGPFELGETYGERPDPEPIDWASLRLAEAQSRVRSGKAAKSSFDPEVGVRLEIPQDGLYRLRYEDLAAAGFDFRGTPVHQLALTTGGEPRALHVEGSGAFGPGDVLELYGETVDTLYTGDGVYLLRRDRTAAKTPVVEDGTPTASATAYSLDLADFERERAYNVASPTGDPWFDTRMLTGRNPGTWTFPFDLEGLVEGTSEVPVLEVDLWGVTNFPVRPDHHVVLSVNGVPLADETFDGLVGRLIRAELPPDLLQPAGNVLRVDLPGDTGANFDLVHLDGFRVLHPRRTEARDGGLELTAPGDAVRVTNLPDSLVTVWRTGPGDAARLENVVVEPDGPTWTATFATEPGANYAVASAAGMGVPRVEAARSGSDLDQGPAQYLVVGHPAFLDALAPLTAARESEGWAVKVVDVEDVYGRYGHGYRNPAAIRDYVAFAAANLGTEAVLLVGGDTYDYRDFLGRGSVSFLPTLYAGTSETVHFAPADPLIGDVDGDGVPDLAVGRFPVRSVAETHTLVAKTLAYESKSYGRTAVLAADRRDAANSLDFSQESERFLEGLGDGWSVDRAYLDVLSVGGAREQLVRSIEEGAALTSFVGHSGPTVWSFSNLFNTRDAEALGNAGQPTVVVQWGCWNAYHVEPLFDTLGHDFLLSGDRGAAAVLGSTTLLSTSSSRILSAELAPLLSEPGRTLGSAVLEAKRRLAETRPELLDVLVGWTLLGDPALIVEP